MTPVLPVVIGISGGSGAVYAGRLIQVLVQMQVPVHLVVSRAGWQVIQQELGWSGEDAGQWVAHLAAEVGVDGQQVACHQEMDYFTPIASGSFLTAGMVICPCSGSTLSAVATGASRNLLQRAAEVQLKERRPLILVPRETPVSRVALKNMLDAHDAGATILPASPGWYHGVKRLEDLVDFMVARILDQLKIPHQLMRRWGS